MSQVLERLTPIDFTRTPVYNFTWGLVQGPDGLIYFVETKCYPTQQIVLTTPMNGGKTIIISEDFDQYREIEPSRYLGNGIEFPLDRRRIIRNGIIRKLANREL